MSAERTYLRLHRSPSGTNAFSGYAIRTAVGTIPHYGGYHLLRIERQGCQTRADIQDTRYLIQATASAQDNLLQGLFNSQNQYLAQQFCDIKSREDQREIQALRDKLAEQRDTANTLAILNAIQNKDVLSGSYDTTAKTFTGNLS